MMSDQQIENAAKKLYESHFQVPPSPEWDDAAPAVQESFRLDVRLLTKELQDTVDALRGENEEWEKRFALYTEAMERGRKMWQAVHPEATCWPSADENWAWLAGEVTRLRTGLAQYGEHWSECAVDAWLERRIPGEKRPDCTCGLAQARGEK